MMWGKVMFEGEICETASENRWNQPLAFLKKTNDGYSATLTCGNSNRSYKIFDVRSKTSSLHY